MRGTALLGIVFLAALVEFSCAKSIPPVPEIPLNGLDADVRSAIQKARDEAVTQPKSAQASGHLGMVLQAHTLYPPAVPAYERAVRLDPKDFAWHYYLALCLEKTGQLDQSLASITEGLRLRPDYAPAVVKKGELLLKLGRFPEGAATLEPLIAQNPNSPLPLYFLGRVKFAQQDFAGADDLYRRATQAYPTFGAAWFGLGETSKRLGRAAESEKDYQLAEANKDHNAPAGDELLVNVMKLATGIENRLIEAKRLLNKREYDRASQLYKEVLQQYPDNLDCLVNLLFIAQYPNQATPEEAEDLFNRARAASPQLPQVYLYHGTALVAQGKFDAGAAEIEKAIQLKPADAEAHAWLADVRERQHRLSDAIDQYQIALTHQPDFRIARMELAKDLLYAGRSREAIPVLLPVLQVEDSNTPYAMMFLTQAYVNLGDRQSARKYLEQAHDFVLRKGPSNLLPQIEQNLKTLGAG
ncbi:MAG TPA: tetratricopeptide repeat protein [Bryobacteraceae bacterium]|nr:tetratricopeptide repeat protein [Bryobacteraceae bacterium]